jgi:hypothetical protein
MAHIRLDRSATIGSMRSARRAGDCRLLLNMDGQLEHLNPRIAIWN